MPDRPHIHKSPPRGPHLAAGLFALLLLSFFAACSGDDQKQKSVVIAPANNKSVPPPEQRAGNEPQGLENTELYFGKFTIKIQEEKEDAAYQEVLLHYNNKALNVESDAYRVVKASGPASDLPLPGCETMTLEMFTGGANCCFAYYILTSCPDSDLVEFNEPIQGGMGAPVSIMGEAKGYPITDPAFMYYSTENQDGDAALSLSRVDSPRPTRYIIFADNVWRADKIGEFAPVYRALAASAQKTDANPAAGAIEIAYYLYMAGDDEAVVKAVLKKELPKEYAPLADIVFNDIVKAVAEFKPFTPLPLP